jgi:hypothetical protein
MAPSVSTATGMKLYNGTSIRLMNLNHENYALDTFDDTAFKGLQNKKPLS